MRERKEQVARYNLAMLPDVIAILAEACTAETPADLPQVRPAAALREELLELAGAPRLPLDLDSYRWNELYPGFRITVTKVDPAREMTAGLLWARPGARYPAHRHMGPESVVVPQGIYRDESGDYGPGCVVRRPAGSVHSVEVPPGDDCISYIVAFGGHEIL